MAGSLNIAKRLNGSARAFSMVEVMIALGLLSFALVGILGLIPTGLSTQRDAQEEARATSVLNMVLTAVRSAGFIGRDASGAATYQLPEYLSNSANSQTFTEGDNSITLTYLVAEDGTIRTDGNAAEARQTMYLKISPPANKTQPVNVYAAVAWPALPTDTASTSVDKLKGRQGFLDVFISHALRN